jgi:hypothetical protein
MLNDCWRGLTSSRRVASSISVELRPVGQMLNCPISPNVPMSSQQHLLVAACALFVSTLFQQRDYQQHDQTPTSPTMS